MLLPILLLGLACLQDATRAETPNTPPIHFPVDQTVVWLGGSRVLAFEATEAAEEDARPDCALSSPGTLEVLRAPEILAGRTTGFLRVRGLAEGECELEVGGARIRVETRASPARARARDLETWITAPVPGAVLWGRSAVGVETWPGTQRADELTVRLLIGDDSTEPTHELPRSPGTWRRSVFELDADSLPEGPLTLRAVVLGSDGAELERSTPVRVEIRHPAGSDLVRGECEDTLATPRPAAFGDGEPRVGSGPEASEARFVVNASPDPTWLVPFDVERPGLYQMTIIARGDQAGGALPSVGLCVSDPGDTRTSVRLVDQRWHRLALGRPVPLEAGPQVLGVRFLNDFALNRLQDRNLFLDRYELLRVDSDDPSTDAGKMGMASMSIVSLVTRDADDEDSALGEGGVAVAFERPLDGLPVNGRLVVEGFCRWDDPARNRAPVVELLLDGASAGRQQAAKPTFVLDRADFRPGANELQLVATLADGRRARTPVQTVQVPGDPGEGIARATRRFSVLDERWEDGLALSDENEELGHAVAGLAPGAQARLRLPVDLAGDLDLVVMARGPGSPAAATLDFAISGPDGDRDVGSTRVHDWWSYREVGHVTLRPGPKTLVMSRAADEDGGGELVPFVRAVVFRARVTAPDRVPPRARIAYPSPGFVAHGVDAVVAEAWDDDRLEGADVLIDGVPQGTYGFVPDGAGYLVLPLLLRGIPPGEHSLQVRVADRAGNMGESAELPFVVAAEPPAEPGPYARAIHLLNRLAYGPDPRALAAVLTLGERAWLERSLAAAGPGDLAALGAAEVRMRDAYNHFVERATVVHAMRTDDPVRARFVFWLENHFSTWIGKTQGPAEWREHLRFMKLGAAPFGELLLSSATSPTMLWYLDQQQSFAGRLNENYAREIMELHTVGVDGGYTQEEVTSLAGILAGLTLSEEALPVGQGGLLMRQLRYDPLLGDGEAREILGMRFEETAPEGRFDRLLLALELLAAHPSTAGHVARELAEHYVATPAPERLVADLARVFERTGGDMREMMLALAEHPDFRASDASERVATPMDYALRLARTADVVEMDWAVQNYLSRSGMGPFERVTPDGYPDDDAAWVDTNAMLQRWHLVGDVPWAVRNLVSQPVRQNPVGDPARWRQRVVDLAAVRLTGAVLGAESNRAALEYVAGLEEPVWAAVDRAAAMVSLLPEASLK